MHGRVDDDPFGPVVDERAVPAGTNERRRLSAAQVARVGDCAGTKFGFVRSRNGEPVVVVGALRAVRRGRPECAAEGKRRRQAVAVDPHEGVPETVNAAVAAVARARVRANGRRLARPPDVDRGRHPCDEPVREPGAAARVVTAREHVLEVAEREALVHGVRPPNRMHDPVTVGEHEAALPPDRPLDRGHRRPRVARVCHEQLEFPGNAVARRLGKHAAAAAEVDGGGRAVGVVPREQGDRRDQSRGAERRGKKEEGGPEPRATLPFVVLPYLIWNVALPVVWFPAMSVASQRNSVVSVTTNDWPGSRGPVESHNVDVLLGFEPSVV